MNKRGLTLIELLIVLVISSILIAGIYRTFIGQQHTYTVQEQVVDMQQSLRMAINQMVREIRMAGLGDLRPQDEDDKNDPKTLRWTGAGGMHGKYKNIVNPSDDGQSITVVGAFQEMTFITVKPDSSGLKFQVDDASGFNTGGLQYLSINGTESARVKNIVGKEIELFDPLTENHFVNEPVFRVMAITYSLGVFDGKPALLRNDNVTGDQPLAENIEFLQFTYTLEDGTVFVGTVPGGWKQKVKIRMVQVTIRARTDRNDPELGGGGDGFRRRTLTSNIQLRNLSSL
ncbi:MAG: prepilin-type N-terminal cleavage/methylation domain-containing protein [Thermodesulfobacteriota bacterium]|nr:prepilin-type N-terminal cleavage/methylation domain-containing protein [Thermodesulfobacteriota bacterium]